MYQYQPLPYDAERHRQPLTRILYLHAGVGDEPLSGALEVIDAENTPPYEALSYCWGSEGPSTTIRIEGSDLPIRSNLAAAMRSLRRSEGARRIWIDALCINQSNVEERTRQVQYMRRIYQCCAKVIAWLGPESPDVKEAFELAARIIEGAQIVRGMPADPVRPIGETFFDELLQDISRTVLSNMPASAALNLVKLLDCEYFHRHWVLQEVFVGRSPVIKCGELEIPFLSLASTRTVVHLFGIPPPSRVNVDSIWQEIARARDPTSAGQQSPRSEESLGSLQELLIHTRCLEATDSRDKIFSLLGICDEGIKMQNDNINAKSTKHLLRRMYRSVTKLQQAVANQSSYPTVDISTLEPNYKRDTKDVYIDVARYLIAQAPGSLDILHHVQHRHEPLVDGYPSWVPKWFESTSYPVIGSENYRAGIYETTDPRCPSLIHPILSRAAHPQGLSLEGFRVGIISNTTAEIVSPTSTEIPDFDGGMSNCAAIVEQAWSQLFPFPMVPMPPQAYRSGEPLNLAFCRVLCTGGNGIRGALAISMTKMGLVHDRSVDWTTVMQVLLRGINGLLAHIAQQHGYPDPEPHPIYGVPSENDVTCFRNAINNMSIGRKAFLSQTGHLGLGPPITQPGDEIVVFYGGRLPFLIRRQHDHYILIGECYVEDDYVMLGHMACHVRYGRGPPIEIFELR
ncbi:heterokaryon incompatibility protein-domain-containing protein [Stachybotrys elegans]|uniref:Heterokaryon incompatibility protein-domain-containing protein n=1 Tax=Stachybotrys elegans TaxID=80388 RepID=A0A8K0WJU9_9HYPO|nr:heterokaryon incompatibility protein-domain-containing protein [Stachybotrys elegans]